MKLRIHVSFAKRFLKNFHALFESSGGKEGGCAGDPERALKNNQLAILIRPRQGLEFGKVAELRMLFALGNFNDRVKIHHASFEPLRRPGDTVGARRAGVDLALQ